MKDLIKKENDIFGILQKFIDAKLEFVIVGGYAVSSFKHRFSVDADIVIKRQDLESFETILKKNEFKKTISKELENIYSSKFVRYAKSHASVDILIDALASRTTNAAFSYDLLFSNSSKRKIIGIEKEITTTVPHKEMLIITKIHSGRLTDFRDIAALAKGSDLDIIKKFLFVGDLKIVKQNLEKLHETVNDKRFVDSFKGVFIEKKFDIDLKQVEKISQLAPEKN
ncbi:MAG: hypothetical protein PHH54_02320 [Candidatus Nanoarchaeia archaeon]|nr:hypothetical protein [Candidatus Nanoarchaeia archaeon]MDD5740797.1 hypothetical protein [Candidatus Nanoarchaeia archaeon]